MRKHLGVSVSQSSLDADILVIVSTDTAVLPVMVQVTLRMDSDLGHLYHDSSIRGTFTVIDAREQLRMRGINAREQRHLDRQTYILDRAKDICERSKKWEQERVQRLMRKLHDRTQSLNFLMKHRSECTPKNRYESKFVSSAPTFGSRKSEFADVPAPARSAVYMRMGKLDSNLKPNSFKKRSNHVARVLVKLQDRSDERKRLVEKGRFRLAPAQVTTLQKARVTLKGTDAEAVVTQLLERGSQQARDCSKEEQSPTQTNHSKSSNDGHNRNMSSIATSQSTLGSEDGYQSKYISAMSRTRAPKLPELCLSSKVSHHPNKMSL